MFFLFTASLMPRSLPPPIFRPSRHHIRANPFLFQLTVSTPPINSRRTPCYGPSFLWPWECTAGFVGPEEFFSRVRIPYFLSYCGATPSLAFSFGFLRFSYNRPLFFRPLVAGGSPYSRELSPMLPLLPVSLWQSTPSWEYVLLLLFPKGTFESFGPLPS